MAQSGATTTWSARKLLGVAVVLSAILGSTTGFAAGYFSRLSPAPVSRDLTVYTSTANFNDTLLEQTFGKTLPHDIFLPDRLVVNKGDRITIHFYNTEDEPEDHTYTMDDPYKVDKVQAMQTTVDIAFTATTPGLFQYWCRFHLPTMVGYLVVQG